MKNVMRYGLALFCITMWIACAGRPQYYPVYQRSSEPIIISERVGEIIDAEEREYYGLFQGIDGFKEAIFFKISGYGYDAVITTDTHTFTCCNRDSVAIDVLREYIERYEDTVFMSQIFERKWKIVDYDDLGFAITEHEVGKIRHSDMPALYGACGCLAGGCVGAILGNQATPRSYDMPSCPESLDKIYLGIVLGGIGGCLPVWIVTKASLNADAIQKINQYRQPQILE